VVACGLRGKGQGMETCQSSVRVVMQNCCVVWRVGLLPDLPITRFDEKFGSAGASPSQLKNLSEFCQSCDAKLMRQQAMRGE
jgi:hypothetical protein